MRAEWSDGEALLLERLLALKLLTEEETFAIDDIIADESPEDTL